MARQPNRARLLQSRTVMRPLRSATLLALSFTSLVAVPRAAHGSDEAAAPASAEASCDGWFCGGTDAAPAPVDGEDKAGLKGEAGTVTLPGGIEIPGRVLELVPGDHVTLQLADGSDRSIPWLGVLQIKLSARIVIGGGAVSTSPPAPTAAPATPAPVPAAAPPPVRIYTSPAPVIDRPRPRRARHVKPPFEPAITLGGRFSLVSPTDSTRSIIGDGGAIEVQLGYRFSPYWRVYGALERANFGAPTSGFYADSATSTFVGAGLEVNLAPYATIGYLFDVAFGYRTLDVPSSFSGTNGMGSGNTTYSGFEPLRLSTGIAFPVARGLRMDLLVFADLGAFSGAQGQNSLCATSSYGYSTACGGSSSSSSTNQTYETLGVALGGHFEL